MQYCDATCMINTNLSFALILALQSQFVGKSRLGYDYAVHAFPRLSIDGGLIAKLSPSAVVYLDVIGLEEVLPVSRGIDFVPVDGITQIDELILDLSGGMLNSTKWRRACLFLLVSYISSLCGHPIDLLVITKDSFLISKLLSRLPHISHIQLGSELKGGHQHAIRMI